MLSANNKTAVLLDMCVQFHFGIIWSFCSTNFVQVNLTMWFLSVIFFFSLALGEVWDETEAIACFE